MFSEEKLDLILKQFPLSDLKIPYTDLKKVMGRIEARFILRKGATFLFNNWILNLKDKKKALKTERPVPELLESVLLANTNYWVVFVEGPKCSDKHRLFDCKINAALELSSLFSEGDIFIVDRKYRWMVSIQKKRDQEEKTVYYTGSEISFKR